MTDSTMIESERDLFVRKLRELYTIERQLAEIQSSLASEATDEDLEAFFMGHSEATTEQLGRLDAIFEGIDAEYEPRETPTLSALLDEREALIEDVPDPNLDDRVTAETGRAIERLEVTKLETILALANRLDVPPEVVEPLETTRIEAENAAERLEALAV